MMKYFHFPTFSQSVRIGLFVGFTCLVGAIAGYCFLPWCGWERGDTRTIATVSPVFAITGTNDTAPQTVEVVRDDFLFQIRGRGGLESQSHTDIFCKVQQTTTLTWLIPEGTRVKKGDLLARLDEQNALNTLYKRQLSCLKNENNCTSIMAKLRNAEIALDEYIYGTFVQDRIKIENKIFENRQALKSKSDLERYSRGQVQFGYMSKLQLESIQTDKEEAKLNLQKSLLDLDVLLKYTSESEIAAKVSSIGEYRDSMQYTSKFYEYVQYYFRVAREQLEACSIRSPVDGEVVYANQLMRTRRGASDTIQEGSSIVFGQLLFRIPDSTKLLVRTLVNETDISSLSPGMPAMVVLAIAPEHTFTGHIERINLYPETVWRSSAKNYMVNVVLDHPEEIRKAGIPPRIGLTADVEFLVQRMENVVLVPIQSVLFWKNRAACLVWKDGEIQYRPIETGPSDDHCIVVTHGLEEGEQILPDPDLSLAQELIVAIADEDDTKEKSGPNENLPLDFSSSDSQNTSDQKIMTENEDDNDDAKDQNAAQARLYEIIRQKMALYKKIESCFSLSSMEWCDRLDRDRNQIIDPAEFRAEAPEFLDFLNDWDSNADGSLTLSEFVFHFYSAKTFWQNNQ